MWDVIYKNNVMIPTYENNRHLGVFRSIYSFIYIQDRPGKSNQMRLIWSHHDAAGVNFKFCLKKT